MWQIKKPWSVDGRCKQPSCPTKRTGGSYSNHIINIKCQLKHHLSSINPAATLYKPISLSMFGDVELMGQFQSFINNHSNCSKRNAQLHSPGYRGDGASVIPSLLTVLCRSLASVWEGGVVHRKSGHCVFSSFLYELFSFIAANEIRMESRHAVWDDLWFEGLNKI